MTNLTSLPQIPAATPINIVSNADFDNQFYVAVPGFSSTPLSIIGSLTANSATVSSIVTAGIAPGMLAMAYGIPSGTTVTAVGSDTITLSGEATQTFPGATITLFPPPLDLTGITFTSTLRLTPTSPQVLLSMSTANGLMTNGATNGKFGWSVPAAGLPNWPPQLATAGQLTCVVDIQATDATGAIVNMCAQNGPIQVNVSLPNTR